MALLLATGDIAPDRPDAGACFDGTRDLLCSADIASARRPAIRTLADDSPVAILAYSSILPMAYWTDERRQGCAPMRAFTVYEAVEPDQPGTAPPVHSLPHEEHRAAMQADIATARQRGGIFDGAPMMPRDRQDAHAALASRPMGGDSGKPGKGMRVAAANADVTLFSDLIGYRLRLATNAMTSDLKATLEGTRLRPVLVAMLAVIARNPGIIQTAVGNALGVQRANLVPLVNEVCERGLVERRPAPNDKRAYALHLTAAGEQLLEEVLGRIAEHEDRLFGRLTQRERDTLKRLLGKVSS